MIKLSKIKPNPNNPRFIRDHRFEKLKKSLKEFPEMMELRPIIVNREWITLGGNMRLRALQELGHKEIPETWVRQAELSDQQQREFVVKDNLGFGDWDWDVLANEWGEVELTEWGLEFPGHDANNLTEGDLDMTEEFDPVGVSAGLQRVTFIFDGEEEASSYLHKLGVEPKKHALGWEVNLSTRSIL